jgi:acylphosphatase
VFYRASARDCARQLDVTGWAANLPDGGVEVVARGTAPALAAFAEWLVIGPPLSMVANVTSEIVEIPTPAIFEIR